MATPYTSDNLPLLPFPTIPSLPDGQQFEGALVRTPDGLGYLASPAQIAAQLTPTVTATAPPPVVTLRLAQATVTAGQSVALTATVTAGSTAIKTVEFFDGGDKIGVTLTSSPYQLTYTPQTTGKHALVAKATDAKGLATVSDVQYLTVTAVGAVQPTVTLSPVTPTSAVLGTSFTLVASASVAGGSIAKVEFFDGAAKLGEDTSTPYALAFTPGSTGQHALSAKATDLNGNTAISATQTITITAVPAGPNQLPTVSLTLSPATLTLGQSTTLTSLASDTDGTVTKVEFFDGTTSLQVLTAAPYQYVYNPTGAVGSRTIKAVATDNQGGTATATQVLAITAPATAPGAPTIGTSTAGDGYAITTATAPASTGSSATTAYYVYRVGTTARIGTVAAGQALTFTDTGVVNGTPVQYQWTAVSTAGEGPRSAASVAVTPAAVVVVLPTFELALTPVQAAGNPAAPTWFDNKDSLTFTILAGSTLELRYNPNVAQVAATPVPAMQIFLGTTSNQVASLDFAGDDLNHLCGVRNTAGTTQAPLVDYAHMQIINSDGTLGSIMDMKFTSGSVLISA